MRAGKVVLWAVVTMVAAGETLVLGGCAAALIGKASSSGAYGGQRPAAGAPGPGSGSAAGESNPSARTPVQVEQDRKLAATLRSRLRSDPATKALVIGLDVYRSVVTLRGDVRKAERRSAAERVVRSVPGVQGLRNEMRVR